MNADENNQQEIESRQHQLDYMMWLAMSSIEDYNRLIEYQEEEDGHE